MIFVLGDPEHAIPATVHFCAPPVCNPSDVSQNIRKTLLTLSHARKLAKAKRYLWEQNIQPWTRWKGCA